MAAPGAHRPAVSPAELRPIPGAALGRFYRVDSDSWLAVSDELRSLGSPAAPDLRPTCSRRRRRRLIGSRRVYVAPHLGRNHGAHLNRAGTGAAAAVPFCRDTSFPVTTGRGAAPARHPGSAAVSPRRCMQMERRKQWPSLFAARACSRAPPGVSSRPTIRRERGAVACQQPMCPVFTRPSY